MAGIARPRGTEDLLPAQLAAMKQASELGLQVAMAYGYHEMETPVFEATELFQRGVGDTTDVVRHEMYTFADRGGRSLTLRPDGTTPVVRAFWESELRQSSLPVRLAYVGPMFRYDRPGRGRYRQFHQLGVEALGDADAEVDAEVIAVAWRWLERLGLKGLSLQLNSIGDRNCRPHYRQALLAHFAPHLATLAEVDQERLRRNPLRILDSKEYGAEELMASAPSPVDYLCPECADSFARVKGALDAYGISYCPNPRLVRGLDYYVRTAFEVWHEDLQGAQNALFGGGRYDGLSETIGYPPLAGVGFAAGLERIVMMSSATPAPSSAQVAVLAAQRTAQAEAIRLAETLRAGGRAAVICDVGARSLKAKMRSAEKSGAGVVCILGEEELQSGTATVRRLSSREQVQLGRAEVEDLVRQWLGQGGGAV